MSSASADKEELKVLIEELGRELPDTLLDVHDDPDQRHVANDTSMELRRLHKKSPLQRARNEILTIAKDVLNFNGGHFGCVNERELLTAVAPFDAEHSHLSNLGSFFVALSEGLTLLYVSGNVDRLTPFTQSELIGRHLLDFVNPKDHRKVENYLSRKRNGLLQPQSTVCGTRQFFHFRLKNAFSQYVSMMGRYRKFKANIDPKEKRSKTSEMEEEKFVFLGVIRPVRDRAITELSLMESVQDQYITRHLPDGKIIFADHRISTICGYLPSELVGMSGFNFIMGEDLPFTTMAQRHMFANTSGEGFTTYRLRRKDGQFIFVQTRGYLEISPETQKVDSFMCINTIVKEGDGPRFLEQQRARFTPYIARYQREIVSEDRAKLLALFPETKTLLAPTITESPECEEPASKRFKSIESQQPEDTLASSPSAKSTTIR